MPKRRYNMNEQYTVNQKRRRPSIRLEDAPPVNCINDLIEIGKSIKFYKNLDTVMLWRVTPYLEELNNLVGMEALKESLFYQIIYYLQNMHTRNQNEEYLHTIITGPPGTGKCLKINTPVLMYNGSIKMVQDITSQDLLMGDDNTPRTVLSTCQGTETMYEIQQSYGDNYTVNESHILSLKLSKSPQIEYIPLYQHYCVTWYDKYGKHSKVFSYTRNNQNSAKLDAQTFLQTLPNKGSIIDISIKDYLNRTKDWISVFKGYKTQVQFPTIDIDIDPYIFGYWLGDRTKNKPQIITQDEEILNYFTEYFNNLYTTFNKSGYDMYTQIEGIMKGKNKFISALRKYNIWNNKHIPNDYKINNNQTRLEILAGILDSDGYLNKKGNWFEIIQQNINLANDIVFLSRSLGFRTTIEYVDKSCKYKGENKGENKNGLCQCIFISGNIDQIPTKLLSKKATKRLSNKDPLIYSISLKKLDEDKYYGFEIDGNHRFLLGDFTVTHNTTVARIIGKIYQSMGVLSKEGNFKVAYRDDFIAEYLGKTAIKTRKLLNSCIGGVLFIDEVYALAPRSNDKDSFSKEALDTLTAFLSEHKNDFCCIAAGYEKDINECFFAMNSGLQRRFPWVHNIKEYTSLELTSIFTKMVKDIKWDLGIDNDKISKLFEDNKDLFQYAGGDIETFITKCKMTHSRRIFNLGKEHKFVLTLEDLQEGINMVKKHKKYIEPEKPPPLGMYL